MSDRWSTLDLVEGFQLSQGVAALHELGVLSALERPATAEGLAAELGLDAGMLRGTLEYVAARTDLVRRSGRRFKATRSYSDAARFLLDLYVGAYAGNAVMLADLLRKPSLAPAAVDRARHARAFEDAGDGSGGFLPETVRRLGLNHVLDLGCGSGALLLALACAADEFVGWGLDLNAAMCRRARARMRSAGVEQRVRVIRGDCEDLESALSKRVRKSVAAVVASNVANEMFAEGHQRAVRWLEQMSAVLPGRPLLIADYYGCLGRKRAQRETLLHDFAQLISGQGIPPPSASQWRSIYSRAGCRLVHIVEDTSTTRFVHILALGSPSQ